MSRVLHALICACLLAACVSQPQDTPDSVNNDNFFPDSLQYAARVPRLALVDARVIDGTGNPAVTGQTLLIEDGIIKLVGNTNEIKVPDDYLQIEGKTIIPGFVGMHNHLHMPGIPFLGESAAMLYLAAGVTTMQTCGSADPEAELDLAAKIARREADGPHIIPSAPYITGPGGNPNMIIPRDAQHLRDTMDYWMDKEIRIFKVYRNIRPEDLEVVIRHAHEHGALVTGHLCSVTFEEAVRLGIDGIEHGLNSASDFRTDKVPGECSGGREFIDDLPIDGSAVEDLFRQMISEGVYMTSTLSIYETSVPQRVMADELTLRVMAPALREQYEEYKLSMAADQDDSTRLNRLKRIMAFEKKFADMGGMLVSGPDPGRHNLPGFGDQRNFELLVEAGFPVEQAVKIMTSNGAGVLNMNQAGVIAEGYRADLMILSGNLGKAGDIRRVEFVSKGGFLYNSQRMIRQLAGRIGAE